MTIIKKTTFSLALIYSFLIAANFLYAWSGPSHTPPSPNVSAPITVGTSTQSKQIIQGSLGVDNLATYGNMGAYQQSNGGYVTMNPWDGAIEIGSGNDNYSYIDFHANTQLTQDFGGRIGFDGTNFNIQNSGGWTNVNVAGSINPSQICLGGSGCKQSWSSVPQGTLCGSGTVGSNWRDPYPNYCAGHDVRWNCPAGFGQQIIGEADKVFFYSCVAGEYGGLQGYYWHA